MPFKIGNDTIKDIYVGSDKIEKIYVGNDLVYSAITDDLRFNYSGIDINGKAEYEANYDGNPVAYMIGKYGYSYYRYTQVTPTPTEASAYANKYVYVASTDTYTICVYDSSASTLTPDWVVVGTTPCYTQSTVIYATERAETATLKYKDRAKYLGSAFNKDYWGDDITTGYSSENEIPTIPELETLVLPDMYAGKPVTQVIGSAFYGRTMATTDNKWYPAYQIKNIILGANITTIDSHGFQQVCHVYKGGARSFVFNNSLKTLSDSSISGVFGWGSDRSSVTLPSSVTSINAQAFGPVYGSTYKCGVNKLTITSPSISCLAQSSYGIVDHCNYVIFENTVTYVGGVLKHTANSPSGAIVFKHSQNQNITLSITKEKSAIACTIYTDCDAVKNYDWASQNYTVTFKALSEYTGG